MRNGWLPRPWTTDHYLHWLNKPQIFGTQFHKPDGAGPWTMEPFDRQALSDAERAIWCVVPLVELDRIMKGMSEGKPMRGTSIPQCK
jgi:hypothetical protein